MIDRLMIDVRLSIAGVASSSPNPVEATVAETGDGAVVVQQGATTVEPTSNHQGPPNCELYY